MFVIIKPWAHSLIFVFCLFAPYLLFSDATGSKDDEKVIITESTKKLTFFINKRRELLARLSVSQTVISQTDIPYTFTRSIAFDNNSAVGNIKKVANRRTRSIDPIISDYESDGVFHSDLKLCYFDHKFTSKGESATFSYEKVFTDLKFLDALYFNDYFETENSQLIIEIPNWVQVDLRELNFDLEQPKHNTTKEKDLEIHTYSLENLPAAFRFNGAPRRSKMNAHLIVIPNSYQVKGETVKLIESVDDLYSWYASLVAGTHNDNKPLHQLVEELCTGKTDDLDKIKSIYYWVQDNIRYIAFEYGIMGFQPENCQTVFNNKYGDCKGMANLTKEMLNLAGYDARLTWLGTADIPYDYDIPSLLVDNHMICTVILDGEKIFLDPTEKYAGLYNYAFRVQGQQALIEDGEGFVIERIPTLDASHNKEIRNQTFSINEEKLEGTGKVSFKGNRKSYILYLLSTIPEKDWNEVMRNYISNGDKNLEIELRSDPELEDRDQDFELEYTLGLDHHIIDLGEELYVNLESDFPFRDFEMPEERNVPYEFSGTYMLENTSALNIPEGWKVSYLPEPLLIDNEKYLFTLSFQEQGEQIIYQKRIEIREASLVVDDFKTWNVTIATLKAFYADQIILSKK